MQSTVFLTDSHTPYRDQRAHHLSLQIMVHLAPTQVVIGSDGLDCYMLSNYDQNPERSKNLQSEIDQWKKETGEQKQAAPGAQFLWIPGNHESRLRKLGWKNPALFGLEALEWRNLLDFARFGIERPKNDEVLLAADHVIIKHGSVVRADSAYTAKAELLKEKYAITTVTGHTHRLGKCYVTKRDGEIVGVEAGCLCSMDVAAEYVRGVSIPNWQLGMVIIWEQGSLFRIEEIPFVRTESGKLKAMFQGRVYER